MWGTSRVWTSLKSPWHKRGPAQWARTMCISERLRCTPCHSLTTPLMSFLLIRFCSTCQTQSGPSERCYAWYGLVAWSLLERPSAALTNLPHLDPHLVSGGHCTLL